MHRQIGECIRGKYNHKNAHQFGLHFYHNEEKWCEDWNLSDDSHRMTIIGTIYEHPHLLQSNQP